VLDGGRLELRVHPLDVVGLYVPGGRAAYPSTVLMTVVPARTARVRRVCLATPPQRGPQVIAPAIAAACRITGVDDVFLMGGAQAVAAFAYGTREVPRVDKVCGPGNAYVAAAKRQASARGLVGIDMFAGPSEVLVLDDGRGHVDHIALDLIAQAEHDPRAAAVCVTTSAATHAALPAAVARALARAPNPVAAEALAHQGIVLLAPTLDEAIALANAWGPEHLEWLADPTLSARVTTAGAIFVGHYTPEPVGDYFAGPNHTLPTGGTAASPAACPPPTSCARPTSSPGTPPSCCGTDPRSPRWRTARASAVTRARWRSACGAGRRAAAGLRRRPRALRGAHGARPEGLRARRAARGAHQAQPERGQRGPAARAEGPPGGPAGQPGSAPLPAVYAHRADEALSRAWDWPSDGILIGNGSNELLVTVFRALLGPGERVLRPSPCFSVYPLQLALCGAVQDELVLSPEQDYAWPEDELVRRARSAKVVLLTTPNNPTGSVLSPRAIERVLESTRALVVIDEAYREFCGQELRPLLRAHPRVVLLRTFSKAQGLAGLRFGVLLARPSLVTELRKVILPYSVSALTQAAALELLSAQDLVEARVRRTVEERARLAAALRARGRRVIEGGANFVLMQSRAPREDFSRMLAAGVLVRDLSGITPGFLRVSVGTPDETDRLLAALPAEERV
jgi:histidinol-phosphate aminotransferase